MTLNVLQPSTDLPPDFFLIMYGMRRSGKTTAVLHMLESMKDRFKNHKVHIITGTGGDNPIQWKNFPMSSVHTDLSTLNENVGELIDEQRQAIMEEAKRQMRLKDIKLSFPKKPRMSLKKSSKRNSYNRELVSSTKNKKNIRGRLREMRNISSREPDPQNDIGSFPTVIDDSGTGKGIVDKEVTEEMVRKWRREGKLDEQLFPHHLLILDDVVCEDSIRHAPNLNKLAVLGRHIFITVIILSHCVCGSMSVPPGIRLNSDFIMCMGLPRSKNERKLLCEQYMCVGKDEQEGIRILSEVSRVPHRLTVIQVTNVVSDDHRDFLYTYGPTPEPPQHVSRNFKLGLKSQWEEDEKVVEGRKPNFTDKDKTKRPPPTPKLQAIDSGRFSSNLIQMSRTPLPNVPQSQFLDPFF